MRSFDLSKHGLFELELFYSYHTGWVPFAKPKTGNPFDDKRQFDKLANETRREIFRRWGARTSLSEWTISMSNMPVYIDDRYDVENVLLFMCVDGARKISSASGAGYFTFNVGSGGAGFVPKACRLSKGGSQVAFSNFDVAEKFYNLVRDEPVLADVVGWNCLHRNTAMGTHGIECRDVYRKIKLKENVLGVVKKTDTGRGSWHWFFHPSKYFNSLN